MEMFLRIMTTAFLRIIFVTRFKMEFQFIRKGNKIHLFLGENNFLETVSENVKKLQIGMLISRIQFKAMPELEFGDLLYSRLPTALRSIAFLQFYGRLQFAKSAFMNNF